MTQVTDVSYRLGKSNDPKYCEVIASFKYKGKRREYYIFVKKNGKYKPNTYLKAAQKQFAADLKNGKVADAYMHKAPLIVLATAFAATAIVFGALIAKKYIPQHEGITFDVGNDATLELYDEKQISFPIQAGGVTWDNFYKDHHYFGAVKNGYDFLYWSLDGKNPIDNNYVFTEPAKLVPVFHENTDGVSFIIRHISNGIFFDPSNLPGVTYKIEDEFYPKGKIEVRSNYTSWGTYDEINPVDLTKVGDVVSFKTSDSFAYNRFYLHNVDSGLIISVSGDTKNLVGGQNYKDSAFQNAFSGSPIYSASGLTISGNELSELCCTTMFASSSNLVFSPKILASKMNTSSCAAMFGGCVSLLVAPELPATTLAEECYESMFAACNSLIEAPILPATTLEYACYRNMFGSCYSLTAMPALPATATVVSCYESMFSNCSSLTKVYDLPATKRYKIDATTRERVGDPEEGLAESCYYSMFEYCLSLTEAPYIHANKICCDNENRTQFEYMFYGCSSLSSIKINYVGNFKDESYGTPFAHWMENVSNSGTFYYNGNTSLVERGTDSIPEGWTIKKF